MHCLTMASVGLASPSKRVTSSRDSCIASNFFSTAEWAMSVALASSTAFWACSACLLKSCLSSTIVSLSSSSDAFSAADNPFSASPAGDSSTSLSRLAKSPMLVPIFANSSCCALARSASAATSLVKSAILACATARAWSSTSEPLLAVAAAGGAGGLSFSSFSMRSMALSCIAVMSAVRVEWSRRPSVRVSSNLVCLASRA
mmetsp:Transcript_16538/g.38164  ORF Transcript_16538/g.38164 Transcript_16538/m.38164 type:complete len:202 (+) Transcript_16538:1418-2023(+)